MTQTRSWYGISAGLAACSTLLFACAVQDPASSDPASTGVGGNTSSVGGNTSAGGSGGSGVGGSGIGGSGIGGTGGVVEPPPFEPAAGMLRRLTRTQFHNAVQDVFGVDIDVTQLDADIWTADFAVIGAASVATPQRGVEQYHEVIEAAVDEVFADATRRDQFLGCTPTSAVGDACMSDFIERMGRRAWRRPLEPGEVDRLLGVFDTATAELESAVEGARWATVAMFTSPSFIYRPELGQPAANGWMRYTDYEMASRLAFLVWNSLPDDVLLDAAAGGTLSTPEGVRTAADRLLSEPAGRRSVGAFAEEFMRLDRIATKAKDPALFPEYGPAMQEAMRRDIRETWEGLVFDDNASALSLFTTTKVVVNADLAQLYGIDSAGLDSNTFAVRDLPADGPRLGVLGKAGFLAQFANQKEGSPTLRGKYMSEALLCRPIDPPPGNVDIVLEDPPADQPMTKRERLELHRTSPVCAGCHAAMDPLGLPLESFDAVGAYRTMDHGLEIDPSGEFDGVPVADARELGAAVGASATVAQCLVSKYYSYAAGHVVRDVDGTVLSSLNASFQGAGFNLRELILSIVTHEAFASVAPQP